MKPLIEKYLTYLRISEERARAIARQAVEDSKLPTKGYDYNLLLMASYGLTYRGMIEQARKYRLTASAQAMIEALRPRPLCKEEVDLAIIGAIADHKRPLDPDIETPVLHLPDVPIWMELEQPISTNTGMLTGVFFACADREIENLLQQPQSSAMQAVLKQAGRMPGHSYRWSLHFIHEDGTPVSFYRYEEESRTWSIIPDSEPCPTDECEIIEHTDDLMLRTYERKACPFCATILAYWRSWFVTALLAVQGEFAAIEEVSEGEAWPTQRESTTRKVPRPHSSKFDEIRVHHDYYVVSFDASVRRKPVLEPESKQLREERQARGSWVEATREIDPESVVYVKHDFGKTERRLDPEHNPRWKRKRVVPVRGYARRVPMKVGTLQRRIMRVIASRYEAREDKEKE